jgi:hypothetical protein
VLGAVKAASLRSAAAFRGASGLDRACAQLARLHLRDGLKSMALPNLGWMIGASIGDVQLIEPVSWWFRFVSGGSIRADTLWRLIGESGVRVTSEDHRQMFGRSTPVDSAGEVMRALSNVAVTRASITETTGDLVLEFENGLRIDILTTSCAFESWSVFSPSGEEIVALGGGDISVRKNERSSG